MPKWILFSHCDNITLVTNMAGKGVKLWGHKYNRSKNNSKHDKLAGEMPGVSFTFGDELNWQWLFFMGSLIKSIKLQDVIINPYLDSNGSFVAVENEWTIALNRKLWMSLLIHILISFSKGGHKYRYSVCIWSRTWTNEERNLLC